MRDKTTPIDQRWVQHYCEEFLEVAGQLPEGKLRDAVMLRVDNVMDLVEAWQKRDETLPPVGNAGG